MSRKRHQNIQFDSKKKPKFDFFKSEQTQEILGLKDTKIHPLLRDVTPQNKITIDNPLLESKKYQAGVSKEALNPYFDPTEIHYNRQKKRKALAFNEKGKYIERANQLRDQKETERLEKEEAQRVKELGLEPDESINELAYKHQPPPRIEWWDQALFLPGKTYDDIVDISMPIDQVKGVFLIDNSDDSPITRYVQHPVTINAPWEKHLPTGKPMYLTKKELKRIRKNNRVEEHEQKQDRIRLGLDPAPAPKVKLANLMNVLTNEAIKDPTAVEMRVKQEIEQRRIDHEAANEGRKLTPEEREAKRQNKVAKDINEKGVFCSVFKIDRLVNNQHVFKVDMNAKQFKLTGAACICSNDFSLVIAEGSVNAINKYKRLLLSRVKWTENVVPKHLLLEDEQDYKLENLTKNRCTLIWEGQLKEPHFKKWSIHNFALEDHLLGFLDRYNLENYWREAKSFVHT